MGKCIAFIISSLSSGGAERVMSKMANYWATKDYKVTIVTIDSEATDFYSLHPKVKRISLNLMRPSKNLRAVFNNNIKRFITLRRQIRFLTPNIVISFMDRTNILTLLACIGLNIPVIVSERSNPRQHNIGKVWSNLRRLTYPWADALVVQSNAVYKWAQKLISQNRIHIIPNPVELPVIKSDAGINLLSSRRYLAAMGRLSHEKGFDLLIRAFAECSARYPEWSLLILGEGNERKRLEALAAELGIRAKVEMPGRVKAPAKLLRQADLFVLSSRYEGFPNALLEAMACGLPVISFDCPSGPREIIRNGVDGLLVPQEDVNALAAAIYRLMSDEEERKRLSACAPEVVERFGMEKVMAMWEALINQVIRKTGS